MAFAEDLLKQAFLLVRKEPKNPSQASLRRAVSTAYYALFHLLIQEACANWNRRDTRDFLARAFDHKTMKDASARAESARYDPTVDPQVVSRLRKVVRAFRELQQERHLADYSNATKWTRADALDRIERAQAAFTNWKAIRNEFIAQRYLISLLSRYKEG